MNLLTGFSDAPRQKSIVPLADGTSATLELEFSSLQRGWFYNLTHEGFSLLGQRVVVGENILRQFIGQVPFGLSVLSVDGRDPRTLTAFSSRKSVIILLEGEDIALVEARNFTRE